MHVLITGGTGFIGRALCEHLLAEGHSVDVFTRPSTRRISSIHPEVKVFDRLERIDGSVDGIVNLAGANLAALRWTDHRKRELVSSRIDITRSLVDWMSMRSPRPRVLVSSSAIGWYGNDCGDKVLTEGDSPGSDFPADLCRQWEQQALRANELGVRVCVLRTGVVLGPDGGALQKMLLPFRLGLGGAIGSGRQWFSWIGLHDIVRLIYWLLTQPGANGAYNGTAPNPIRNLDFATTLARVLHRPALFRVPRFALKLALGEMSEMILGSQRVVPERALVQGFTFECTALEQALKLALHRHM